MGLLDLTVKENNNVASGRLGFIAVTSSATAQDSGNYEFSALVADEDSTYSATSIVGSNLPSKTRTEGSIRLGRFSAVTVTSGTVLAYLSPRRV